MKKKITLLSALVLGIGVGYGQISQNLNLPKAYAKKTLRTDFTTVNKTIVNENPVKAEGDTIWMDQFEDSTLWTAGGTSPDFNENGWSIVSSIHSWAFNPGTMGTSGKFANFTNGDPTLTPSTELPGPFTLTHNTALDLSAVTAPYIEFEQYGARFITLQAVQVSVDNGTTWTTVGDNNDIDPLTADGGSPYPKPMTRKYSIVGQIAADPSNVMIRLFWDGAQNGPSMNYIEYGWFVDNIRIIEGASDDLSMLYTLGYTGSQALNYTKIPSSQTGSAAISFVAQIQNVGANSQDAVLNVSEPTTPYAGVQATPTTIASGGKDSVYIDLASGYTIPSTTGVYDFTYKVTSNNNTLLNTSDDSMATSIEVTDSIFATDGYDGTAASMTGSFTGWASGTGDPSIGTLFEFFNTESFQHVAVGIANIAAADQANYIGNLFHASVLKYDGSAFVAVPGAISNELVLTADMFGTLVDLSFATPISGAPGDLFLVVAGFYENSKVPIAMSGLNVAGQTVGLQGSSVVSLYSVPNDSNSVEAPVVRINFGDFNTVTISPSSSQVIELANGTTGSLISVTELPSDADSREWKYATVSGGPYTSFATAQTGFSYTPNHADFGSPVAPATFYVVCESTFGADVVTSNEVMITFEDHTGISENNAPNFAVYSIENGMKVDLSSTTLKDASIRVVSMDGRVVANEDLTSNAMNTVDVNVPTGIYFYTISNDTQVFKGKVFIK